MDTTVPGFISVYGRNNLAEDKAELFAFMISQHQNFKKISNDKILIKKTKLMISRLKGISKDMNKNFGEISIKDFLISDMFLIS